MGICYIQNKEIKTINLPENILEATKLINKEIPRNSTIIPLTENSVLACGYANKYNKYKGISWETARNCTDRISQRMILHNSTVNPKWEVDSKLEFPFVMRTPTSREGKGVRLIKNHSELYLTLKEITYNTKDLVERLNSVYPIYYDFVAEEFCFGNNVEINGFCFDNKIQFLNFPTSDIQISEEFIVGICKMFGFNNCGFNIELIGPPWKIIEVHGYSKIDFMDKL